MFLIPTLASWMECASCHDNIHTGAPLSSTHNYVRPRTYAHSRIYLRDSLISQLRSLTLHLETSLLIVTWRLLHLVFDEFCFLWIIVWTIENYETLHGSHFPSLCSHMRFGSEIRSSASWLNLAQLAEQSFENVGRQNCQAVDQLRTFLVFFFLIWQCMNEATMEATTRTPVGTVKELVTESLNKIKSYLIT